MNRIGLVLISFLSTQALASVSEAWPGYSRPSIALAQMTQTFSKLPLTGRHAQPNTGWSDDYWANQLGSINRRWNTPRQVGFNLRSPPLSRARSLSAQAIAELAPSEKYDLWRGRYDYPLVKKVARKANPDAKSWAGICNGWAPASLNLKEPMPVTLVSPDGISVPFGSSDIKALLSYFYAQEVDTPTRQVGLRCYAGRALSGLNRGCRQDLNAGAFHIILTNSLGLAGKGFLADIDRLKEVWNQPILGYQSRVLGSRGASFGAARGTVREVIVETDLIYAGEIEPQWERVLGTPAQNTSRLELEYRLELDRAGNIIGGEWISWERPDFLWFREEVPFTGEFQKLAELYKAATQY